MATGTSIYVRGEEGSDFDDVWDDTALIAAYDRAISRAKAALQSGSASKTDGQSFAKDISKSSDCKQRSKNRNKQAKMPSEWNAGDCCQAKYNEDGQFYEADILSIESATNTCQVEFAGYKNIQIANLDELVASRGLAARQRQTALAVVESSNKELYNQNPRRSSRKHSTYPEIKKHRSNSGSDSSSTTKERGSRFCPPTSHSGKYPSPPLFGESNIPAMPLPPPPPVFTDDIDGENEALTSMLMAWYMSGYHTGYYQGLKTSKERANHPSTASSPCSFGKR